MRVLFLLTFFLSNFSFAYNLAFDENLLSIKKVRKISSNFCKPCRSGVEEVSLLIAPSYDLKDVGEVNVDFVWYRPPSNIKKYGTYFVDRNEGVRDVFFKLQVNVKE